MGSWAAPLGAGELAVGGVWHLLPSKQGDEVDSICSTVENDESDRLIIKSSHYTFKIIF